MNRIFRCLLVTFFAVTLNLFIILEAAAAIQVTISSPAAGAIAGKEVRITAGVQSGYEVQEVFAMVAGTRVPMTFSQNAICSRSWCSPGWIGLMSLAGVAEGPLTLRVTAKDITGSTGSSNSTFIHDTPPAVSLSLPEDQAVSSGSITLKAECTDLMNGGCTGLVATVGNTVIAEGKAAIEGVFSLLPWNGQSLNLAVTGKDSAGQTSSLSRTVYVETSPMLKRVQSVSGKIWDADATRILFLGTEAEKPSLKILQRATGIETTISDPGMLPIYGHLSSRGALFVEQTGNVLTSKLYDWRDGALLDLGGLNSTQSLEVAGQYAIWNEGIGAGQQLHFRDEASGKDSIIATNAGNWMNSVASNGAVAYWTYSTSGNYNINFYQNGQTRKLTNDTDLWNTYPLTDGQNVVYRKQDKCCNQQKYAIYLYDSGKEVMLAPPRSAEPSAGRDYTLNRGWVAFTRQANDGTLQTWIRSPAGLTRQTSFFGTSSSLAGLSSNGQLMFGNGGNIYFDTGEIAPLKIGTSLISPYYQDDKWWTFIGNTLFSIATQSVNIAIVTTGEGRVSSTPAGIDCGSTCRMTSGSESPITLLASPAEGYTFEGWSGGCKGLDPICRIAPVADTSVQALFKKKTLYQLNIQFSGNGSGLVSSTTPEVLCQKDCTVSLASGTWLTLKANASSGSGFKGWTGPCTGTLDCRLLMDSDKNVSPLFENSKLQPTLTLSASSTKVPIGANLTLTSLLRKTSAGAAVPTGKIVIKDGLVTIFEASLNSSLKNVTSIKSLDAGIHQLTASYSGDSKQMAVDSVPLQVEILPSSTRTTLAAKPLTMKTGGSLTLTASVVPSRISPWSPGGEVSFYSGSQWLGSGALSSGKASLTLQLPKGSYSIHARYPGDSRHSQSSSSMARISVTR